MNFGGPILKNKLFFFLDYEGFRQTLKPLYVLHAADAERNQRQSWSCHVKNPITGVPIRKAPRFRPARSIRSRRRSSAITSRLPAHLPVSGVCHHRSQSERLRRAQVPFTDNSDKGDLRLDYQQSDQFLWFLRISDRKENGRQLSRRFRCRSTAQRMAQSAFSISRSRSAIRTCSARTRFWMRASASRGPRRASTRSRSARMPSRFPAFKPCPPDFAGGLPQVSISDFTTFGRQSTNPQWQNPALLDPKVNFTWVKGKHSLKFGYEYEHIWMAVNDNNPLYGSLTTAAATACAAALPSCSRLQAARRNCVAGTTLLGRLPVRHAPAAISWPTTSWSTCARRWTAPTRRTTGRSFPT